MSQLVVKVIQGIVGCGKSQYATNFVRDNPNYVILERDIIRIELFGKDKMFKGNESLVTTVWESRFKNLLQSGYNVVSSDTNLNPKTLSHIRSIASEFGAEVTIDDSLLSVPLDVCIKRDKNREPYKQVGEKVIRDMYNKYLNPDNKKTKSINQLPKYMHQDSNLAKCILVDIDGTIALNVSRSPYDWMRVDEDLPNIPVISIIKSLSTFYTVIFFSGRDEICRELTLEWISKQFGWKKDGIPLYMRPHNDFRNDALVKKEMFNTYIKDRYYVQMIFDDRNRVVDMYRKELNLPVCQVNYGDF